MGNKMISSKLLTLFSLLLILLSVVPGAETWLFGDSLTPGFVFLIMLALCFSNIACILKLSDKHEQLNNKMSTLRNYRVEQPVE